MARRRKETANGRNDGNDTQGTDGAPTARAAGVGKLYEQRRSQLERFACHRFHLDPEDARDVVGDGFLAVLQRKGDIPAAKLAAALEDAVRDRARRAAHRAGRLERLRDPDGLPALAESEGERHVNIDVVRLVGAAMASLSPAHQRACDAVLGVVLGTSNTPRIETKSERTLIARALRTAGGA